MLVQVRSASVNAADWHLLRGKPFLVRLAGYGLLKPKHQVLGADFAGQVETVGRSVTRFRPGDEVFGSGLGGFAEFVSVREDALVSKPTNVSFDQAAAVPLAAITALQGLRNKGKLQPGQRVLINGASGGVGTFAVQIAKSFGAEVTAVCSTRNLEMVSSLGADHVIDYTREDFTRNGQHYDLVLAANGYHSISAYKRALGPQGTYVMTGGSMAQLGQAILLGRLMSRTRGKKMGSLMAKVNLSDLTVVKELLQAGRIVPVIERRYLLSETANAIRYLEGGHASGKLVITLDSNTTS